MNIKFNLTNENEITNNFLIPLIYKTQSILKERYNIINGPHENYAGLCTIACRIFAGYFQQSIESIKEKIAPFKIIDYSIRILHGELRHNYKVMSQFWTCQHDIIYIKINNIEWYVDPTCLQFADMYAYMSNYYIGHKIPWYFYPDIKNPRWKYKILQKIDAKVKIRHYKWYINIGIVDWFQYIILGFLSDIIHRWRFNG